MPLPFANPGETPVAGTIGLPDDYQRITATPDAFGAQIGQADQKLGGALEQAGGTAVTLATEQQQRDDHVEAAHTLANFKTAVTNASWGNPQDANEGPGFLNQRGGQAVSAFQPTVDGLEKTRATLLNGMSPGAARLFDQASQGVMSSTYGQFSAHRAQAQTQYQAGAYDALATSSQNAAIAGSADPAEFGRNMAQGRDAILSTASLMGWSPEATGQALQQYQSGTYVGVAKRMSLGNPQQAMAFVTANQDKLTPADFTALQAHLAPAVEAWNIRDMGQGLYAQFGGGGGPAVAGNLPSVVHQLESGGRMAPGIFGDYGKDGQPTAFGPMQVHAGALADVNAKYGTSYTTAQLAADPALGRKVGEQYLGIMVDRYPGRPDYALGAYNQGPGAMDAAIKAGKGVAGLPGGGASYVANGMKLMGNAVPGGTVPGANQAQATGQKPLAFGDELAAGAAQANGFGTGATQSGATPDQVLDAINAKPLDGIPHGTPVVLSTGLTADPTALDTVQQQIDSLKARGVTDIRLMGVAAASGSAVNPHLEDIAKRNGITYVPVPPGGEDGIHPASYAGLGATPVPGGAAGAAGGAAGAAAQPQVPDFKGMMAAAQTARNPATGQLDPVYQERLMQEVRRRQGLYEFAQKRDQRQDQVVLLNAVMGQPTPGAVPATTPGATPAPDAAPAAGPGSQAIAPSGAPNPGATTGLGQPGPARPTSLAELMTFPGATQAFANATPQVQASILSALDRNAKGNDPPTTPQSMSIYYGLKGMAVNDPEGFQGINLADPQLLSVLPHATVKELMDTQVKGMGADERAAAKNTSMLHALAVVKPDLVAAGFKVTGFKPGDDASKQYDAFTGKLVEQTTQFQQDNNRRPNDAEIRKIGQGLLMQGTIRDSGMFWDSSTRAFQTTPDRFVPTVPAADKAAIVTRFQQMNPGQTPSDRQVAEIFMQRQAGPVAPRPRAANPAAANRTMGPPASAAPTAPAAAPAPAAPTSTAAADPVPSLDPLAVAQ